MHTKGNWICKKNTDGSWVVMSGDIVVAVFNRKDHPEWNESNARLIAAAPELLEACKMMFEALDNRGQIDRRSQPWGTRTTFWKILRDIIAKAESEV